MLNKYKKSKFLLIVITLSFFVRLYESNQSFWLDEAAQAIESTRPLSRQFQIVGDFQPPLFHLIVHFFAYVNHSEWWLRMASIIPGIVTIIYVYVLAKKYFSDFIAKLAILFGALSAYHVYFSQELRPYSLAAMFGTMSFYYYLEFINSKNLKVMPSYIVASALAMYSTYLTPLILATQVIITGLWYKEKLGNHLKQLGITASTLIPWIPMFLAQLQTGMNLKTGFVGWSQAVSLPWYKSLPLTAIRFLIGMIKVDVTPLQVTMFVFVFGTMAYFILKYGKSKLDKMMMMWLIVPTLGAFLISFFIPVLEPKRLLYSLPALWILIAMVIEKSRLHDVGVRLIIGIYLIPLVIGMTDPGLKRENWKSSVDFINQNATDSSIVIFAFSGPFAPYTWYGDKTIPAVSTKILTVPNMEYLDKNIKDSLLFDQIFVYDYLMDLSDPQRLVYKWLVKNGYTEAEVKDFHGVGFIKVFQKTPSIAINFK